MTRRHALSAALRRTLQQVFGVTELREGHEAVIRRMRAGVDTLALMPAGASQSLCDQLPALRLRGPLLVISPRIEPVREPAAGREEVIYTTPERLAEPDVIAALRRRRLARVVIDEGDCLSWWGHDFRPACHEIGRVLEALGGPPVLALTTTAPPEVLADIRAGFGRPALEVIDTGLYRANLCLRVVPCAHDDEKLRHTLEALHRNTGPGIVYTATVKACTDLHELLRGAGEPVTRYHGKLPLAERTRNQQRFRSGEARVMVATDAFGVGIDRPDLRFVLHWQVPGSPEAYYQEAGRAGRDGQRADAALLFDRRDRRVQQSFLARRYPSADELARVHARLADAPRPLPTPALAEALGDMPRPHLAVALEALHAAGAARPDRRRAWQVVAGTDPGAPFERVAADYVERAERDRAALERMVSYAQTGLCRWRVLLEHLGETPPFDGGRCGHCDNCLHPPAGLADTSADAPTGSQ